MSPVDARPSVPPRPSRLWLWIVVAFVIQAAAWTAWFTIASKHHVDEIPLATGGKQK